MTPEELRSLNPGDKIRHQSSGHTLRCTSTVVLGTPRTPISTWAPTSIWVEKNFFMSLEPIWAWDVVSQPRHGPAEFRMLFPFS